MRRKKRRKGSLSKLVELAESSMPGSLLEPEANVCEPIRVQADEIRPIGNLPIVYDDGEEDDPSSMCGFLGMLTGGRPLSKDMTYLVKSNGKAFKDSRVFSYEEGDNGWRMTASWSAGGSGKVPMGLKMIGGMQGLFNQLLNVMMGGRIEEQDIIQRADSSYFDQLPKLGHGGNGEQS